MTKGERKKVTNTTMESDIRTMALARLGFWEVTKVH